MLNIVGCISSQHDLRLVLLACLVCVLGSATTLQMLARRRAGWTRHAWVLAAGIAFGCGTWVTHFVAMLGYTPATAMAFDVSLTALSLLIAVSGGSVALACVSSERRGIALLGGLLLGATIAGMHFTGMRAVTIPGLIHYDLPTVACAWIVGLVLGASASLRFRSGRTIQAALMLVLAVAGVHFVGMTALTVVLDGSNLVGVPVGTLAVAISAVGCLILLASLGMVVFDILVERSAARENARLRRFADVTFEGLVILKDGLVVDVNSVLCRMLKRNREEMIGATLSSLVAPEHQRIMQDIEDGAVELEMLDAGGTRLVVDVLTRPFSGDDPHVSVLAVRDASERKRAERRIQELVHVDPLTGLANRLLLRDRLAQALAMAERSGGRVAVLCLDLDRFKAINDIHGHHFGDKLLIEVGRRLAAATAETDTVARLGGDEFVIVQTCADQPEKAQALAQQLVDHLARPYLIDGRDARVTASLGVALYPDDAEEGELLLNQADLALYRAKQEGHGGWRFFEPAMDTMLRARRALEQDLRHALERGEFHLHYQPVFSSDGVTLKSYEALLRWQHPGRGSIPPGQFIPVAEECGAILPIGLWALETACTQAASWPEPLGIAVNVSPAQFKSESLPLDLADILARTGLAADRLELEVTEGVLISDTTRALAILSALKALGVRIALDDFGTGYSSLSYLRRFPFDRLKIDRSFVSELGANRDADAVVKSILAMSRSLRLDVTAEGIETEQQLSILRELGCENMQGYLLGKPGALETVSVQSRDSVAAHAA